MRRSHLLFGVACGVAFAAYISNACVRRSGHAPVAHATDPSPAPPAEPEAGMQADTDAGEADAEPAPPPEPPKVTECKATVLVYHHIQSHFPSEDPIHRSLNVTPASFDKQLDLLASKGYSVIPYARLVDCMQNGNDVPAKSVVLTFDDRWKTQYVNAFPLLKRHKMTATFFITTATEGPAMMTWKEVKELDEAGMTIGSHTRTHPMLSRRMQEKALAFELKDSRKAIEEHLGKAPDFLAYPYGGFDQTVRERTAEAGYVAARSVMRGKVHKKDDLYAMKAEAVPENLQAFIALLER